MKCSVEILSVGNELLLGNTVNTNASWIAANATSAGAVVSRITTIGDKLSEISTGVQEALRRKPHFLITTGGIGPTFDDMTLKGVGIALGQRIRLNQAAVTLVRDHYIRRFGGRTMKLTKARMKMASIPEKGIPIRNPIGTAPGVRLAANRTMIFCLPGVPSEAKAIFLESILPEIRTKAGGTSYVESWLKISGIMESTLAPIIDRVMANAPGVYIKSHPRGIEKNRAQIELHFSSFAITLQMGNQKIRHAVDAMRRELRGRRVAVSAVQSPTVLS